MKSPKYRWWVAGVICLLCFSSNYIQFQISSLAYIIMPEFRLTISQFSSLLMAPMLTAVFISIPAGMLGDRFGGKRTVSVGCIISVIGAYGRLFATTYLEVFVMLILCGVFISLLNANLVKILSGWFGKEVTKVVGMYYASSALGIITAQMTGTFYSGLNSAYIISSTILLIGTVLWIAFVKNSPGCEEQKEERFLDAVTVVGRSKGTWLVAVSMGLGMGSTIAFEGILPQALSVGKGMSELYSDIWAAVITCGTFIGSLAGPVLCSKCRRFKPFLIGTTFLGAGLMYLCWNIRAGWWIWIILFFTGVFVTVQGPVIQSFPILLPEIGERYAGSAGGVISAVAALISYLAPVIVGFFSKADYTLNLKMESLLFAASVFCVILLPELKRQREETFRRK